MHRCGWFTLFSPRTHKPRGRMTSGSNCSTPKPAADAAVKATGKQVKVETAVVRGELRRLR